MDIEHYRARYGYYPETAHADKFYRTKTNRLRCQAKNIRLSAVPLGRPPKDLEKNRARRKLSHEDYGIRNAVEGTFGQPKRRFSLNRVIARLAESSKTVVAIIFLVMNLEHFSSVHFLCFFLRHMQSWIVNNGQNSLFRMTLWALKNSGNTNVPIAIPMC